MSEHIVLGLNRIVSPGLSLEAFLALSARVGFDGVELRNDLDGVDCLDGLSKREFGVLRDRYRQRVVSINALQRFNDTEGFLAERLSQMRSLLAYAERSGAEAVILCPVNDAGELRDRQQCLDDTVRSLAVYGPLLREAGIKGLVEPLGFASSSLRYKKDALEAIDGSGFADCYALVHDTFHHYLSGEKESHPERTALIHVSSVPKGIPADRIDDASRFLPSVADVMESVHQVKTLLDGGFSGCISFEPFSPSVQAMELPLLEAGILESLSALGLKRDASA